MTSLKRYKPFGCDQAKSRGHETFEADRSSRIFAIVANIPTSLSLSIIVRVKILFPLLAGASFEEDENLHDMWAALLANASSPDNAAKVRPGFIATLRQMAPDEAALLIRIAEGRSRGQLAEESTLMEAYCA